MNHLIVIYDDVVFLLGIYVAECTINNEIKQKIFIFFTSDKSKKYCFVYNTD